MHINLSDSEWKLMNCLWDRAPMTITELTAALRAETGWAKRYSPAVAREDAALTETENFLTKVYGGSLGLMVSSLVDSHTLTQADLAELSAILERVGGDEG